MAPGPVWTPSAGPNRVMQGSAPSGSRSLRSPATSAAISGVVLCTTARDSTGASPKEPWAESITSTGQAAEAAKAP